MKQIIRLFIATLFCYACYGNNGSNGHKYGNNEQYTLSDSPRTPQKSEKRGVSYAFSLPDVDMGLLNPSISWFYNWSPDISTELYSLANFYHVDYCPMAWNGSFDAKRIRAYKAQNPSCQYLLAFNEPNLTDQCNYTPTKAAQYWPQLKALADELDMKIVSPAMNYGTLDGYGDPIVWLDEFFTLVPVEDIDAISVHCYMGAASAMKSYVERFKKYGKPIWMTEFCAWEPHINSANAQMKFMSESIIYLEACPDIARYAWFIPRTSGDVNTYPYMQLLTKTQPYALSELGKVFVYMSTCDTSVYVLRGQRIEAEAFTACNINECIGTEGFSAPVHFRPTTDTDGNLDICDFNADKWVEYQTELLQSDSCDLTLRYSNMTDASITLQVDGQNAVFAELPSTNGAWDKQMLSLKMKAGKHSLRILVTQGSLALNWLILE